MLNWTLLVLSSISAVAGFSHPIFWKGEFGRTLYGQNQKICHDSSEDSTKCLEWNDNVRLTIRRIHDSATDVNCTLVKWKALDCTTEMFEDCFDLTDAHWYGGTVMKQMYWPIEQLEESLKPYVVGNALETPPGYGSVQERYWLNSKGLALYADWNQPLWVSINSSGDQKLCMRGQYRDSPYYNYDNSQVNLAYTVCQGRDVRHVHDYMSEKYFSKPADIPDERLFRFPIWSTWAQYKTKISQEKVLEFATDISAHGFSSSQLEIDDKWQVNYGDLEFDKTTFPDPKVMAKKLETMGFRATLWVHPFVSLNSPARKEGMRNSAFVTDPSGRQPALTSWWDEESAMIIDMTNPKGADWFSSRLKSLQARYNISSFKFDAGETSWLPSCYKLRLPNQTNPSVYSARYAQMAYNADSQVRHQEIRVGAQTQHLPVFVRMLDKDSKWDNNNGLQTLIPHALNVGVIGYPFILPDMVGGNAYGVLPDRELFIRWVELNVFLPSVQYSIVPWQFDNELVEITRNMSRLHESYAQKMIDLARESTVTGAPIIRPLWWIAPTDPVALVIDSEFLVGDDLLVAPVVEENARSRDVYLPAGSWKDELRGGVVAGSHWLRNYKVELNELPYFTKTSSTI